MADHDRNIDDKRSTLRVRPDQIQVSVVIPAYNAENVVARALDCVARQTISPLEVIVVNDGSTDRTQQMAEEYLSQNQDLNIKLVNQPNRGPGAGRNTGIRVATGIYIAFLDADDLWYDKKLERMSETVQEHRQTTLFCHDEYARSENGHLRRRLRYGPYVPHMYEHLLFVGNCVSPSATIVRADALESVGGFSEDRSLDSVEDYDLWLRLARAGYGFYFLHEVLGEYTLSEQSLTANVERHLTNDFNLLDRWFAEYDGSSGTQIRRRKTRRYGRAWYGAARAYARNGELRESVKCYMAALRRYPTWWKIYAGVVLLLARWAKTLVGGDSSGQRRQA